MIYRLKGILIEKQPTFIVIDVNGVAYEVGISLSTYSALPMINCEAEVYTHMSVREDGVYLFGFHSIEEKFLFLQLINVSGIGPKLAVKILGGIGIDQFKNAIASSDCELLSTISGVGKKTAQRIVVELKDKFKDIPDLSAPKGSIKDDVVSALINLGYKQSDCIKAVENINSELSFEEILREAFKLLSAKN